MDKKYTYVDVYWWFWSSEDEPKLDHEKEMLKRAKHLYDEEAYSSRMACHEAVMEYYEKLGTGIVKCKRCGADLLEWDNKHMCVKNGVIKMVGYDYLNDVKISKAEWKKVKKKNE
jgi:hypothetical protein